MEAKENYRFLLERYYNGSATAAEAEELFAALRTGADEEEWTAMIGELQDLAEAIEALIEPMFYRARYPGSAWAIAGLRPDNAFHPCSMLLRS